MSTKSDIYTHSGLTKADIEFFGGKNQTSVKCC